MQTRIIACAAGALLGVALTPTINGAYFGFTPTLGYIACTVAGAAIGCAASILLDVFRATDDKLVIRPPR